MRRRAGILAGVVVLAHVPDLVRYGSKPMRERSRLEEMLGSLRSFQQAVSYPPNQAFIGNMRPEELWGLPRPWWRGARIAPEMGPFGEIIDERSYYDLLAEVDQFDLVRFKDSPDPAAGELPVYEGERVIGAFAGAHDVDEALSAGVLLEGLTCKASGAQALRFLLRSRDLDPEAIEYVVSSGEEAVGDRYQRGGGNLAKAIAEAGGLTNANGSDVKAFCAGPLHALVMAGALVDSGVFEQVAVVAGGSLAKLGMKFLGAVSKGTPILEDVLAGMAFLVGPTDDGPHLRLDAVGRHRVRSGSSQQTLLEDIVGDPLDRLGRGMLSIDRYATELHNPEITEPAGGGDVPDRNYRMLAGLAVLRGELRKEEIGGFARERGLPGFSPTQGHIASAVPWLPHALERLRRGELRSTMLLAKGSLFLGRLTRLWDGVSIILEV